MKFVRRADELMVMRVQASCDEQQPPGWGPRLRLIQATFLYVI